MLKECARAGAEDAELYYYLGMAHAKLKESKPGKVALERALALNVNSKFAVEAKRTLAELR